MRIKPPIVIFGLILLEMTMVANGAEKGPDWVCVTREAGWQPRDSQGEFVYKDHM